VQDPILSLKLLVDADAYRMYVKPWQRCGAGFGSESKIWSRTGFRFRVLGF